VIRLTARRAREATALTARTGGAQSPSKARCQDSSSVPARSIASTVSWSAPISSPIAAYGPPSSTSMVAGRPIRFSLRPISRMSRRLISSATRLETVALLSPVAAAMSAREQGAWART
jgi:hypothetical protein